MKRRMNWKMWLAAVALPLVVGGLSALGSRSGMEVFQTLQKPAGTPPAWLFPIVWSILFVLMGSASGLVWKADAPEEVRQTALVAYGAQLLINFFWPLLFFTLQQYLPAFLWLVLLWLLIAVTLVLFWSVSRIAGILLIPYLLWVTYAGYLNFGVYRLNS